MRPLDLQQVGEELAIKWDDQSENFIPLQALRQALSLRGLQRGSGRHGKPAQAGPEKPLSPAAFRLKRLGKRWGLAYAIQPVWGDGHATGLYSFEYLRRLTEAGAGS